MRADPYRECPCGSGEKLRFCCPKKLQADLKKLLSQLGDGQIAAALALCDRVLSDHPDQACFLSMKGRILVHESEFDAALECARKLEAVRPEHPLPPLIDVLVRLNSEPSLDLSAAAQRFVDGTERMKDQCLDIALRVALSLYARFGAEGRYLALRVGIEILEMFFDVNENRLATYLRSQLPVLGGYHAAMKDHWMVRAMNFSPRLLEHEGVHEAIRRFQFRRIRSILADLRREDPDDLGVVLLSALIDAALGDEASAERTMREIAQMPACPEHLAIDAWHLATCLSYQQAPDKMGVVYREYPIQDAEKAMERLLSHPQARSVDVSDRLRREEDDGPPPKGIFRLLDRPFVRDAEELTVTNCPRVIGNAQLFGRQTDREARLEVMFEPRYQSPDELLQELLGETIGPLSQEKRLAEPYSADSWAGPPLYFDPDTSSDVIERIRKEYVDYLVTEYWFEAANPLLDGQSPRQVADRPEWRRRLASALAALETGTVGMSYHGDFAPLWERVGLRRETEDVPTNTKDVWCIGLSGLLRVDARRLDSSVLQFALHYAVTCGAYAALPALIDEAKERTEDIPPKELLQSIALAYHFRLPPKVGRRLASIAKEIARQVPGMSPGGWEVRELEFALREGSVKDAVELFRSIQETYANDPEVLEDLYESLLELGVLQSSEDGPDQSEGELSEAASGASMTPGGILLPGGSEPKSSGGAKAQLWIPPSG